ncbi:MAG: polyprenyl synthetase family protein [Planctomycetes bacterium]|nr:polyprenyl synthetase family protein [Planctomycetota bacterium]
MTDAIADLDTFLGESSARVDAALDAWLPPAEGDDPIAVLGRAMRHIALSGGKRLRPALVFAGCLDVDGESDDALGAAVAIEMVHAYSLVHDDLPCMDDATLRRGKPCVHVLHGEAMGVLAGDALLTQAFEVLAEHTPDACPVGEMVVCLARASGWAGMVGGQVLDLDGEAARPDVERVRRIHLGKTAALLAGALRLGVLAGRGERARAERLEAAGRELGLAFQIVDDLLDLEVDAQQLGKDAGDVEAGKMTWPAAVGREQAWDDARACVARARPLVAGGAAEGLLVQLGERILSRRN